MEQKDKVKQAVAQLRKLADECRASSLGIVANRIEDAIKDIAD